MTRTWDLRIRNPLTQNDNPSDNNDLAEDENTAYKPAYKKDKISNDNHADEIPSELAEIVKAWPTLPDHIKQTMLDLVRAVSLQNYLSLPCSKPDKPDNTDTIENDEHT